MSNSYFQFKQFTVHQDKSAMKVCTDACLFGAWMAERILHKKITPAHILDIGGGTGLLSLMLAQSATAAIDSIELDEQAAEQARQNYEASPWPGKLQVLQGDARLMHLGKKYDLIISNPPFFEHDLKSPDLQRNLALHGSELGLTELLAVIRKHISPSGRFAVLLPWRRKDEFVQLAKNNGFFLEKEVAVQQTPAHAYFRAMLLFGQNELPVKQHAIIIRDNSTYSEIFVRLLKPYYLHL